MKKKLAVFLAVLLLVSSLACVGASAADKPASLTLAGAPLDAQAVLRGETVFIPVRAACEALGYSVEWQDADGVRTVTLSRNGDCVILDLTNQKIDDNGHSYWAQTNSGAAIALISNRTYLESGLFDVVFAQTVDVSDGSVTISGVCENSLAVTTEKTASNEGYLKTTVQYPQISGLANTAAQDAINGVFKKAALDAESEGQKNADVMAQWFADGYTGGPDQCETYFDYAVTYNRNGLLSVILTDYQYTGGAHGMTVQTSHTFDLVTGNELSLADLMRSGSGYQNDINTEIRTAIDEREAAGELAEIPGSQFSDIGAEPDYYLSEHGISFYFQEYEYFPYVAGIQSFTVDYASLSDMLNPGYEYLSAAPAALTPDADNQLSAGDLCRIMLSGNPTTGYSWNYEVSDEAVAAPVCGSYVSQAGEGIVGGGGTYSWDFKALTAGESTITFKYYRTWEGQASAVQTVVYRVTVS